MSDESKNYRARRSSYKWQYCGAGGTPCPELGWFYQVSKRTKSIRLLPVDLDYFNDLLAKAGMQPIDADWTSKVPLTHVANQTVVPKAKLAALSSAVATSPQPMSKQNQLAKLIFDYWTARFPDTTSHSVRSDQGGYWGAAEGTPARIGTSLYTKDGEKGRGTWMGRPDVAVLGLPRAAVPYIAEIEAGKHIKPKVPAGLIGACNMSKWHYPPAPYKGKFDLAGAVLFVVLCSESLSNPLSRKAQQLLEFQNHFEAAPGCLRRWIICAGANVDATFAEFKRVFEECCPPETPATIVSR